MKRILRITNYPTHLHNKVGFHCYKLAFPKKYATFFVSPKVAGSPLEVPENSSLIRFSFFMQSFPKSGKLIEKFVFSFRRILSIFGFSINVILYSFKNKIDIIHIHSPMFMLIALYGKCLKKKVYITFHGEDFQRIKASKTYKFFQGTFNGVFTISPTTIPRLKEIHQAPVNLVFNGFDPSFKNLGLTRKKQIIFVGSFKPVKAHSLMLEGFEKFISNSIFSDYNLLFVGEGVLKSRIEEKVNAKFLQQNVIFAGQKSSAELIKLYNESEIFALCSQREGFPKVILEALGCGCKVISTKVGSVPSILYEKYPYFIEEQTPDAVCHALTKVALAPNESFNVFQDIPKRYSWEALRGIYQTQYDKDLCLTH